MRAGDGPMRATITFTLLGLLSTLATRLVQSQKTIELKESDAQALVDAIAQYGSTGEDTTLLFPQGRVLSLANITMREAQPRPGYTPFSAGTLTMMPGPGNRTSPTVFDTAMAYNLARYNGSKLVFTGTARLVVKGLTIVNNCDWYRPMDPSTTVGLTTAVIPSFLAPPGYQQAFFFSDVVYYARQADITQWASGLSVLSSPFPELAAIQNQETSVVQVQVAIRLVTAFAVTLDTIWFPTVVCDNITLASLTEENKLMAPQICEGGSEPLEPLMVGNLAPLWITSDAVSFTDALRQATTKTYLGTIVMGAPLTITLTGTALVGALQAPPYLPPLTYRMVLTGPTTKAYTTRYPLQGTLDCRGLTTPLLRVAESGQLYLQYLRLLHLPTQPLSGSSYLSVFPLSVFELTNPSKPIQAYSITIELPTLDYLALAVLAQPALSAHVNTTVQDHATALKAGLQALNTSTIAPSLLSMLFTNFTGWGLQGANIQVEPGDPEAMFTLALSVAQAARADPIPIAPTDGHPDTNRAELKLIVGLAVVAAVALAALAALVILWFRQSGHASRRPVSAPTSDTTPQACVGKETHTTGDAKPGPDALAATNDHVSVTASPPSTAGLPAGACMSTQNLSSHNPSPPSSFTPTGTGSHLSLHVEYTHEPEPKATGSGGQPGSSDAPQSLLEMLSRTTQFASSLRQSKLALKDVQQLEAFCSALAAVTTTQGPTMNSETGSEAHQVTLVFGNGLAVDSSSLTSTNSSGWPSQHSVTAMKKTDNPSCTLRSTKASGVAASSVPSVSIELHPLGSSEPNTASGSEAQQLKRKNTTTSHTSTSTDPKAEVGQLMEELKGDMNKVDIDGVLGHGSWGTVYSGRWRGLEVALKTMIFEVHDKEEFAAMDEGQAAHSHAHRQAVVEAAVAASVDHPNVVHTYYYDIQAVQTTEGRAELGLEIDDKSSRAVQTKTYKLFLVQERCRTALSQVLEANVFMDPHGRLVQPEVVYLLLLDIARGLEYLHGRNIVHGDLKPANVLLAVAPGSRDGAVAKLADFGFSARLAVGATHVSNYRSGTPFYVAPEVVHEHRASLASDIFSFGVMMWQMYSGHWPYVSSPEGNFTWNPAFPQFTLPNMPPPAYLQLVHRCLTRDPRDRPTASQLIAVLGMLHARVTSAVPTVPTQQQ